MNKRQLKKFCKKGGHYHFDKTIKRIAHKKLMHPFVANSFGHMISWFEIGTCMTCAHCTDVCLDWDGSPYMFWGSKIGCGGCDKFLCNRYKLDPEIEFFKFERVNSESPDSPLKRYIDETIENFSANPPKLVVRESESDDDDYVTRLYKRICDEFVVKEWPFTEEVTPITDLLEKSTDEYKKYLDEHK